jgi:outer membrane protein OmpA-like peptidoglycan-associated protein
MIVVNCRTFLALFALPSILVPQLGSAQAGGEKPAYTHEDIIEHLGLHRGVCIGTEQTCPTTTPPAPDPAVSFDLVITFDYASDVLNEAAKRNLNEFAKALRDERLRTVSFLVEGHTDARGSDSYNLGLSERRAQAVVAYLTAQGVERNKVMAKGHGEAKPRMPDPLDPANRRVETRINTTSRAEVKP